MSPTQYRPIIIIKINYKSKILGAVYIIWDGFDCI
jgi:hypothetical protein